MKNENIFFTKTTEIGAKNEPIEMFATGNRITPQPSATSVREGTVAFSDGGDLCYTKKDKNGVGRWFSFGLKINFNELNYFTLNQKWSGIKGSYNGNVAITFEAKGININPLEISITTLNMSRNDKDIKYEINCTAKIVANPNNILAPLINPLVLEPLEKGIEWLKLLQNEYNEIDVAWQLFSDYDILKLSDQARTNARMLLDQDYANLTSFIKAISTKYPNLIPSKNFTNNNKFEVGDYVRTLNNNDILIVRQVDWVDDKFDYNLTRLSDENETNEWEFNLEPYIALKEVTTPFQQIDFLNPSTEVSDLLIKTMSYYSDGLTFVNSSLVNLKFKLKNRIGSIEILFDKVNNIIKISEPSKNINVWSTAVQQKITDENITDITNLYFKTLEKFIEIAESETTSTSTETKNPNEIKVGDTVEFINKLGNRDKLKGERALVISIDKQYGTAEDEIILNVEWLNKITQQNGGYYQADFIKVDPSQISTTNSTTATENPIQTIERLLSYTTSDMSLTRPTIDELRNAINSKRRSKTAKLIISQAFGQFQVIEKDGQFWQEFETAYKKEKGYKPDDEKYYYEYFILPEFLNLINETAVWQFSSFGFLDWNDDLVFPMYFDYRLKDDKKVEALLNAYENFLEKAQYETMHSVIVEKPIAKKIPNVVTHNSVVPNKTLEDL